MGEVCFPGQRISSIAVASRLWPAMAVDVGNLHAVAFVEFLADAGELREAPHEPGSPDGVNVEFVVRQGEWHLAMRVHERGVGETRSR
jgi:diaminopimelate epimerase